MLLAWKRPRLARVVVAGSSMSPAFQPGDRLLVAGPWPVRAGQVVAVADPRASRRLLVKRVHRTLGRSVEVRGDNPAASTDSRDFGPVDRRRIVGRVLLRYSPADRARWWP